MIIGVPKEIKDNEYRVSLTPGGTQMLTQAGHQVLVERGAGQGSGFVDEEYRHGGAKLVDTPEEVFAGAQMIMKVKEPLSQEYDLLREGMLLFTYLHLAADEKLTQVLIEKKVTAIAYETVQLRNGSLPLLKPMSEIAGRMAVQVAAHHLEKTTGGRGKLLAGVPGVRPADVTIIGAGTVGFNATFMALGLGASVIVIDRDIERLRWLGQVLHGNLVTLASNPLNIATAVRRADVVIGAVLTAGARAPHLVTRQMVSSMKPGSVIVDVAIDQGGCVETSHPTTHAEPVYKVGEVIHYCVTNMPGAVPRTSTYALSNVTLPYALALANRGFAEAVKGDSALARGVNTHDGHVTHPEVARALGMECQPLSSLL